MRLARAIGTLLALLLVAGCPTTDPERTETPILDWPTGAPVQPGAFCSPPGAVGRTRDGRPVTCTTAPDDPRNRWRTQ